MPWLRGAVTSAERVNSFVLSPALSYFREPPDALADRTLASYLCLVLMLVPLLLLMMAMEMRSGRCSPYHQPLLQSGHKAMKDDDEEEVDGEEKTDSSSTSGHATGHWPQQQRHLLAVEWSSSVQSTRLRDCAGKNTQMTISSVIRRGRKLIHSSSDGLSERASE